MLSKNNYHEKLRKMEPRKERFSIRKFSIGAASVLIGFSFMSMAGNQKVQAATEENPVVNNTKTNEHQSNDIQQNVKIDETNKATDAEKVNPTTTSSQNSTDSKLTPSTAQQDLKNVAKDTATEVKQDKQVAQPETTKATTEVKVDAAKEATSSQKTNAVDLNKASSTQASVEESKATVAPRSASLPKDAQDAILAAAQGTQATTSQGQTQEVSDWNSFGAALISPNVGNIVLTNDITANGDVANAIKDNYGELDVTAKDIARKVTIDGQGKYALDFGTNFLAFTNANQGDNNSAWDLTLKDLTVNGDGYQRTIYKGGYGTFYFGNVNATNGQKDTITLDGVTANIKQGSLIAGDQHGLTGYNAAINVVLKGNNTINNTGVNANSDAQYNYASTIQAGTVTVESGTTTMNVGTYKTNNGSNVGGNMIEADMGKVVINEGATLNLNAVSSDGATATDVRGIWTNDNPGAAYLKYGRDGNITVNGTLNANMGAGHSSVMTTGSVNIGKTGVVNIKTKQDNNGVAMGSNGNATLNGFHYAPISIAVGNASNTISHDASLINEGSLTIIRDTTDANGTILPAVQPLI